MSPLQYLVKMWKEEEDLTHNHHPCNDTCQSVNLEVLWVEKCLVFTINTTEVFTLKCLVYLVLITKNKQRKQHYIYSTWWDFYKRHIEKTLTQSIPCMEQYFFGKFLENFFQKALASMQCMHLTAFYDIKDISKLSTFLQSSKNHHFILLTFITKLNKIQGMQC